MKKFVCIAALAGFLFALPVRSDAHSYDRDDDGYPLRYIAYVIHPIGIGIEYGILRPIHKFLSSTKNLQIIFGHDAREGDDYNTWK